jgi:predicted nucleic acid-binding protein
MRVDTCGSEIVFIVVADASVLIHLARIGRFHLLRTVYDQICIASSVFAEVVEKGWGLAGSIETERAVREGWIKVLDVVDKWKVREMAATHRIHLANAETVQLAREAKASVLLADEEEVRELAIEFGLEVRGCLGLLVEAARRELMSVKEAKKDAERLIEEGYRISEEVLKEFYIMLGSEEGKRDDSCHPETYKRKVSE